MIDNKTIGVLGAAKSGIAATKLALKIGYKVILSDLNQNKEVNIKSNSNLTIELGQHSTSILDCDIIIVSPGISPDKPIIKKAIEKAIPVISEVEFASWFASSDILSITGSNGKSTTVSILHNMFLEAGYKSLLGGNIGTPLSENILREKESKKSDNIIHIVELSSFQTERLDRFKSKISCILNISEDHLDRYQDMDEYVDAKLNLVNHSEYLLYDSDDSILLNHLKGVSNTCALSDSPAFYIDCQSILNNKTKDVLVHLDETRLIGQHNLNNAFSACVMADLYGVDKHFIRMGLINFKPLPHRLEKINSNSKVNFYNDSKSTNIKSTLKALQSFNENVFLILGGRDKGSNFSDLIDSLDSVEKVFCYGESGGDILNVLKESVDTEYIDNFRDCIIRVINDSKENQNILLSPACSSYDQFDNYEERGNEFKNIVSSIYE